MEHDRPKTGVGVLIFKDGKILLGKRKSTLGSGDYAGIGGHLEFMESFEDCAKREAKEEAGIEIENIRFLCLSNLKSPVTKNHYVDIGLIADWKSGEPRNLEPEKCENWNWYSLQNLPEPIFASELKYLQAFESGQNYFDA